MVGVFMPKGPKKHIEPVVFHTPHGAKAKQKQNKANERFMKEIQDPTVILHTIHEMQAALDSFQSSQRTLEPKVEEPEELSEEHEIGAVLAGAASNLKTVLSGKQDPRAILGDVVRPLLRVAAAFTVGINATLGARSNIVEDRDMSVPTKASGLSNPIPSKNKPSGP
jgi:hypothetical protein